MQLSLSIRVKSYFKMFHGTARILKLQFSCVKSAEHLRSKQLGTYNAYEGFLGSIEHIYTL